MHASMGRDFDLRQLFEFGYEICKLDHNKGKGEEGEEGEEGKVGRGKWKRKGKREKGKGKS